ncbi:MAG TPA: hypothetical protein VG323_06675 [Thermoanaerobaculia bacterium]|nr:hypothetical protein [Thermoanaerobaculia bacterium]
MPQPSLLLPQAGAICAPMAALPSNAVRHAVIDDVLPPEQLLGVYRRVPPTASLVRKKSLRECKWVGVQLEKYDPCIGEVLLAFQEPEVRRNPHRRKEKGPRV